MKPERIQATSTTTPNFAVRIGRAARRLMEWMRSIFTSLNSPNVKK